MKKVAVLFVVILAVLAGLYYYAWRQYENFLATPLDIPPQGYLFTLEPGSNGKAIVGQLAAEGFTENSWQWKVLMRLEPAVYRVGEYRLEPGLRPQETLQLLSKGSVVQYRYTLVEGWTFRQVAESLGL